MKINKKIASIFLISYSFLGLGYAQTVDIKKTKDSNEKIKLFERKIKEIKKEDKNKQIFLVNNLFNKIIYKKDITNWGKEDYWANRKEFILKGGDCEDYAIAKYTTLVELGFNPDNLVITYVITKKKEPHMVLLYKDKNDFLVLDSLNKLITPLKNRKDLTLVYGFNENILYSYSNKFKKFEIIQNKTYSKFKEVLDRV